MKRHLPLFLIALTFWSCTTDKSKTEETASGLQSDTASLEFRTDRRLETLYLVFLLADYPILTPFPSSFKTDALAYFGNYKNHDAVVLAKALVEKGFVADYAVNWLFQHSDFPDFIPAGKVNFPFDLRQIPPDSLEIFRSELIRFYNETQCERFFRSQDSFYKTMVAGVEDSFSRKDIIQVIEDYFGIKKSAKYFVVLAPLLHSGGFTVEMADKHELFALVGPGAEKDSFPEFDKVFLEQDLVIHEFSHNYANPIVENHMDKTNKLEDDLFPAVRAKVKQEGYSTWESFMYELIVRATTIRIVENVYGTEAAAELTDYEKSVGFEYVTEIVDELKIYEAQRDKYPTLMAFYPNIIRRLEDLSTRRSVSE